LRACRIASLEQLAGFGHQRIKRARSRLVCADVTLASRPALLSVHRARSIYGFR
jgi:hypothetical protein